MSPDRTPFVRTNAAQRAAEPAPVTSTGADGGLVRLRLDLGYDGTDFAGWARQPGLRTVQEVLEAALALVLRLATPPRLTVAGRTDAGVHARGQVCHVDLATGWASGLQRRTADPARTAEDVLRQRLWAVLPPDVRVRSVSIAPAGFDARFAALSRRYAYRICDDPPLLDPLRRREVVLHPRRLDVEAMGAAARALLGEHDFAAYCKRRDGATTIRTLLDLTPARRSELIVIAVEADAFCHSMVRAMTGALIAVGEGRREPDWPAAVLAAGVRDSGVMVAPAHGLTLEEVRYPPAAELATRARTARALRSHPPDVGGPAQPE